MTAMKVQILTDHLYFTNNIQEFSCHSNNIFI